MRNKGFVIVFTIIVTLLCLWYLSFTVVSRNVQEKAEVYATDASGVVDNSIKQTYLDSIWRQPVYSFLGADFTYKEVKDTELKQGLDLQGGMHVTLEVSPVEIIKALSGNSEDPGFRTALNAAIEGTKGNQEDFTDVFYNSWQQNSGGKKLSEIFSTSANRDRISYDSDDSDVLDMINDEVDDAINRSFEILRNRIDRFGTSQPNIQRLQGTRRIQIEIPGANNKERVRKLLQGVAKLEFWEVAEYNDFAPTLEAMNNFLIQEAALTESTDGTLTETSDLGSLAAESTETVLEAGSDLADQLAGDSTSSSLDSLSNTITSPLMQYFSLQSDPSVPGRVYMYVNIQDTTKVNRIIQREKVQGLMPRNLQFAWGMKTQDATELSTGTLLPAYFLQVTRGGKPALEGDVITDANQEIDERGRPAVAMAMNASGAKKWRKITQNNINERVAIVLDNLVVTAPNIISEIPNGRSQITGNYSIEEAKDMASLLKAGSLPAPTQIVEEAIIGPTLGDEAQSQGIRSILAGLAIVVLFMIAYYAKGGLVANAALLFNIFFILGVMANLGSAITLPGIAGIVLTIGMAIDANVLIFERIREELRGGARMKAAIADGYDKAFSSIIDANVTTFLIGIILYVLGQGPVKGFAITLMIGIFFSFFSAVFITRVIVEWMTRKGDKAKISFSTPFSKGLLANADYDFLGKRKIAYVISFVVIAIGFVLMSINGLNLGVDFTGGRAYVVAFENPVVPSDLQSSLSSGVFEGAGTEVKTYDKSNVLKITTSHLIGDETSEGDVLVEKALIDGISGFTGLTQINDGTKVDASNFAIVGSSKVGATIADDIKNASMNSVIFSLIVIFLYILIRFRTWQYGIGAIVALFHDTAVVLSAFAIAGLFGFQFEVDQIFIGAMLTIIGYSINDTVVVFDRIRETLGLKSKTNYESTVNLSINKTISRTLITSVTTMIVVLVLFIFGGEVLRGFSFALLIGIIVGTYSSIFIATPVMVDMSKRQAAKNAEKAKTVVATA